MTNIIYLIITLIIIFLGFLGVVIPILPGVPLIFIGILIYAGLTHFQIVGATSLIIFGLMAILSIIFDYLPGFFGAKKFGVSKLGIFGAFLGLILGLIFGGPIGLILGPLIGVLTFELIVHQDIIKAGKSGTGYFIGFIFGYLANLFLAIIMIILFIRNII